ncbi:MAG: methionine adenosyltransferase [Candidatus Woykebacteria bacterium RIFCSPHIGHO2_12_FULL_45_10]|uniref:Methionine adenosyltransferase n=1 Tax=Candidatus Woykebacteria bacterium RIFCSPHIGHO2_12_FULL_45_10 TaxID=1802603 RepID=A0A1G1WQ31_9BACT|nr:MAG: methionine adenosyltransferase [Candidatus Woykebacteria bacterium RIFCSPHIGHO2_12_FULL_45_10]
MYKVFTSESVAAGHPDKICDQISDAILDAVLAEDPQSHTGIETFVTKDYIVVGGEAKTASNADFEKIIRATVKSLGYTQGEFGFHHLSPVEIRIHKQSPDIALGVDTGGAGDQGMMFGFATNQTKSLMPLPISIAHRLTQRLDEVREKKIVPYLRPDGKSEVSVTYEKGKPVGVEKVVLAAAHKPKIDNRQIKDDLFKQVIKPVLEEFGYKIAKKNVVVNGTGQWLIPGPSSDAGLTGRKIVVDTYGGYGRAGGGAFSGKDPTKVDRSGAYAARFLAKNIVAAGLADSAEVQIAYVIGQKEPLTRAIETFGTEKKTLKIVEDFAWSLLDLSVEGIITGLDLRKPIYQSTAAYGHFGRDGFSWEKVLTK